MNTTYVIVGVVLVLLVIGGILAFIFSGRQRSKRFQSKYGAEYERAVETAGGQKAAQNELKERERHVGTLEIRPLSARERERYAADWTAVQARFVDEPGQAIVDADRLIVEVMQLRAYPVSDFDQRAADVSIQYPELVANYRAARAIAVLNEQHHAGTEDLRQAMLHYRSLFDELLKDEAIPVAV
jgi:hypothetical protein